MAYDRNAYLIEHYEITAVDYAQMAFEQDGVCKLCGQAPTGRDLHVDHDHRIASTKVKVKEIRPGVWEAMTDKFSHTIERDTKQFALDLMKRWLLRTSVRGLICWKCNEGLRSFKNRPDVCRNAANYLDEFTAKVYRQYQYEGSSTHAYALVEMLVRGQLDFDGWADALERLNYQA